MCSFDSTYVMVRLTKCAIHGDDSWQDPIGSQIGAGLPLLNINTPMSVNAGVMVSMQGAGWQEDGYEGKTNLLYAYLPVTLRYQHPAGFYGETGLQPGFLLRAMDKYDGTSESYMDHMKRFDLSIPVTVGYNFKNNLGVNLSVIPGITDITKDEDVKDVNFVIGLGVTYTFKLRE